MTPRTEVDAIPVTIDRDTLLRRAAATPHSRLPVYKDSLDNIVGVLYVRDLFETLSHPDQPLDLWALLRGGMVVPESKPADDLLDEMRASGRYFAIVIDEYGGTAGIVTLEDLVEALVGPLKHEHAAAAPDAPPAAAAVVPQPDGSALVDGLLRLDDLEELTGIRAPEAEQAPVETLGGLVMAHLGRMPAVGDEVTLGGRTLRVEQLDGMRVAMLRLLPLEPPAEPTPPPASAG
jgi:putative hemolysin